jgi:hypothetical protein
MIIKTSDELWVEIIDPVLDVFSYALVLDRQREILNWCSNTFSNKWSYSRSILYFTSNSDKILFLLKWA